MLLTLASPVVEGDVIMVDYTKISTNPLQTPSGGALASITSQPVTNKCLEPSKQNNPPISVIKNEAIDYSGFVYEIDVSGSYDLNNDILIYTWTVPNIVAVSSTNVSIPKNPTS